MSTSHRAALLAAMQLLGWPLFSGCTWVHPGPQIPMQVKVVDAETQQPLEGAAVELKFMRPMLPIVLGQPDDLTAQTDDQGVVVVDARRYPTLWRVHAPGYRFDMILASEGTRPGRSGDRGDRGGFDFGESGVVVHLYREPHATVLLVLPDGYRGFVRLREKVVPGRVTWPTGQRVEELHVSADGNVEYEITQFLLMHGGRPTMARYASGGRLPGSGIARAEMVGFFAISSGGTRTELQRLFLVGTLDQAKRWAVALNEIGRDEERQRSLFDRIWQGDEAIDPTVPPT